MKRRQRSGLLAALAAALISFYILLAIQATPAAATDYWYVEYDFTTGDQGWDAPTWVNNPTNCAIYSGASGFTSETTGAAACTWDVADWQHGVTIISPADAEAVTYDTARVFFTMSSYGYCGASSWGMGAWKLVVFHDNDQISERFGFDMSSFDCEQTGYNITTTSGSFDVDLAGTAGNRLQVQVMDAYSYLYQEPAYIGASSITKVQIWGHTGTSYATVTPTSLYTPVPSGTPGAGVTKQACPTLGDSNALFHFDMDWAGYYTEFYDTSNLVSLVLHPGSFATLDTTLKASRRYSWQLVFMTPATGATGPLDLSAGDQDFSIALFNDTSDHTLTNPAVQLGTEPIELRLSRPTTATGDVVIKYLCLTPEGDSVTQPSESETGKADDCLLCDPPLGITDITGILNWIVCNLRNVVLCVIIPALGEVLKFIVLLVQYVLGFATWITQAASDAVTWVANIILGIIQNLGGQLSNAIFGTNNALITSGAAGLLNQTAGTARDLPTILSNELQRLSTDLQDLFANAESLPELVIGLVGLVANIIMTVLGLIPLALQSLIDGLSTAAEPVSGAVLCTTPGTALYAPCLGFYVLENTLFQGPVRFLIPVLMGIIMFDMLTWAVATTKATFAK